MTFYRDVKGVAPDPIFGINSAFLNDDRPFKVNLGVGSFKTETLEPFVLNSTKQAEAHILEKNLNKEYLPIDGDKAFIQKTKELTFGSSYDPSLIYGAQTIGGTGALYLGARLARKLTDHILIPSPTWDNHRRIFEEAGFTVENYPYYDAQEQRLNSSHLLSFLSKCRKRSTLLLQGCCHNPTGIDPTQEEWKAIASIVKERELLTFFDFAYQGFGKGIEEDASAIRLFAKEGLELIVASSYSKNFGLYAERVGALFFVCKELQDVEHIGSQIKVLIRATYSNPPCHGPRIITTILDNSDLRNLWKQELSSMHKRISEMRRLLSETLQSREKKRSFKGISNQVGMFSYIGLKAHEVKRLTEEYGIYMPQDGRINVAGLTHENLKAVTEAIIFVADA